MVLLAVEEICFLLVWLKFSILISTANATPDEVLLRPSPDTLSAESGALPGSE
jgi:hypothetical protein